MTMEEEKQDTTAMPAPILSVTFDPTTTTSMNMDNSGTSRGTSDAFSLAGTSVRSVQVRKSILFKNRPRRSSVVGGDRAITASDITNIFQQSDSEIPHVIDDDHIDRVRKMHQGFTEGAEFSFNYNTLLLVASVLAGLGLISNSSTTIIASMLVSPIMGPVMGMAFGMCKNYFAKCRTIILGLFLNKRAHHSILCVCVFVCVCVCVCVFFFSFFADVGDKKLTRKALKTELISLLFCIFIGIVIGLVSGWAKIAEKWPTQEMLARGYWQSLLVGLPVAFFSGLGGKRKLPSLVDFKNVSRFKETTFF